MSAADAGRERITFFVHDLSGNPIGRAAPLAAAVRDDFDVEAVGAIPPGLDVYSPFRDQLPIRPLVARRADPRRISRLAALATGGILVACKPLASTLLPALLAAGRGRQPVILDVDDDEWAEEPSPVDGWRARLPRISRHAAEARLVHPFTRLVHAVTVSTRSLQRRYGGVLIRHGPDERVFDPGRLPAGVRERVRAELGLPRARSLAFFAGVPRSHKGWEALIRALLRPEAAGWDLVGVGRAGERWYAMARERLGTRFHHLDLVPRAAMPCVLAAMDAVPVPQRGVPFAASQLPAKLLDAMAMEVPVVATRVGDLPEILGEGARGWLVPPDDPEALAAALAEIAHAPRLAARRGAAARRWFLTEASAAVNRERLGEVIRAARARRDAARR